MQWRLPLGVSLFLVTFSLVVQAKPAVSLLPATKSSWVTIAANDIGVTDPTDNPTLEPLVGDDGGGGGDNPDLGNGIPATTEVEAPGPLPELVQPLYKFERPKKKDARLRPAAFVTRSEIVHRTDVPDKATLISANGDISDVTLAIETDQREAENDALTAKHEYENDTKMIDINKRLHRQTEELFKKRVISRQEFEESGAELIKSEWRADGSKNRWAEFQAEADLEKLRLKQAKGGGVSLIEMAKAYTHLWECRVSKFKSLESEAKATYDYWNEVWKRDQALKDAIAISERELIDSQAEVQEAEIAWKLAHTMVEQNETFYQHVLNTQKTLEQTK